MKNKLKINLLHSLSHNAGLKILALIFSVGLWFIVTNITDPMDQRNFTNIPVEIINADTLTSEGKVYEILDNSNNIGLIKVKGKSSILDKLTKEDIKATADLSEITFLNTVNIKISSVRNNSDLEFKASSDTLKLSVEDVKRTQMVINTSVIGTPAEGYVVGNVSPSQNVVRISGPVSLVEKIAHVDAVANIGNYSYTSDINTSVDLVLYDAEGNEIKNSAIKMNISTITMNISILATKQVPLKFVISGEPEEGYVVTGDVVSSIDSVLVAGKKTTLDAIQEIVISDPSLDITGATNDFSATLNIKKMLPSGVVLAESGFDGLVGISQTIEKIVTKEFAVPKSNFAVANIPEGYTAEIQELASEDVTTFTIKLSGIESDINKLRARDILGIVDMNVLANEQGITQWAEDFYVGRVITNLSEDYTAVEQYAFTVSLKKIEEE